jgi:hypothetical protein
VTVADVALIRPLPPHRGHVFMRSPPCVARRPCRCTADIRYWLYAACEPWRLPTAAQIRGAWITTKFLEQYAVGRSRGQDYG